MTATREIAGLMFACEKLPGGEGLNLFLRTSAALKSARGLFIAIATSAPEAEIIHEYFEFAREMDPKVIQPLIMELSRLPKPAGGETYPDDLDLEAIIELAFFSTAVNFGALLPAGIDPLFHRAQAMRAVPGEADDAGHVGGAP